MNAHIYEVRPRKDKRGVDLISDVLSFGYDKPDHAIGYAMHSSRSHGCGDPRLRWWWQRYWNAPAQGRFKEW